MSKAKRVRRSKPKSLPKKVRLAEDERKKAQAEMQIRADQQAVVAQLGQLALRGCDLNELFNEAVKQVAQKLNVEYCKVLELLPGEKELLLRAGVGWKEGLVGHATVGTGTDSQAGYTLLSKEPVVVEDLRAEKRFSGLPLLHEHEVVSGMSVIISGRDKPFGVLSAHTTRRHTFTKDDINFLQAVANVLAGTIERKRAEEALLKAHDELEIRVEERTKELTEASKELQAEIAERKQTEEDLRQTRDYLENLFNYANASIICWDAKFKITRFNHAFERLTGYKAEEVIGKDLGVLFPEESKEESVTKIQRTLTERWEVVEIPIQRKDGDVRTVLWNSANIYATDGKTLMATIAQGQDITERKMAEKALRESEIDLNRAQTVARTGSWRLDIRRDELLWSDETYRIFEIPRGTPMTYETFLTTVHPDDRGYTDQKWNAALRGEPYDIEHRIIVNGVIKWVREKAELEFDKNGMLMSGFGTVQEITERKRMEEELRDSLDEARRRESEISALLTASKAVLQHREFQNAARLIFDSWKGLLGATAGYVALLSEDEMKNEVLFLDSGGLPCTVDPSVPMPIRGLRAEAYRTGKPVYHNDFPNSEWTKLMPNGHMILENVLFAPLVIDKKTVGLIGIANKPAGFNERDARMALAFGELASIALINSRNLEALEENQKRLKEYSQHLEEMVEERTKKLQDAQRLATIGETAGMVGHDIRNPLQSIEGAVYLAKEELKMIPAEIQERKELEEVLEIIQNQTNYIDHIVAELQDFARTPMPQPKEADIQELVMESLSMLDIPEKIEVQTAFQEDLSKLTVDPVFMKRVIVNLIENAVHAMPNGGRLTLRVFCDKESTYICVEDTGAGIPEEHKPKIFSPLFTTKAKGQGIGLSVCKKLVEAHNGEITFESKPGNTTFKIKLPRSKKEN